MLTDAERKAEERLKFALRAAAKGVTDDVALDGVYTDSDTATVVAVANWATKDSTRGKLVDRLTGDEKRITDLIRLHAADRTDGVLLDVIVRHKHADRVDSAIIDAFGQADTSRHAAAKELCDKRPTALAALVKFLRDSAAADRENQKRLTVAAHAAVAGAIKHDERDRLFNDPKSTTANMAAVGPQLDPTAKATLIMFLQGREDRVQTLFEEYMRQTTNPVVVDAIVGHTSVKMDDLLAEELVAHDEDDPRTDAASILIKRRKDAAEAKTAASGSASE